MHPHNYLSFEHATLVANKMTKLYKVYFTAVHLDNGMWVVSSKYAPNNLADPPVLGFSRKDLRALYRATAGMLAIIYT